MHNSLAFSVYSQDFATISTVSVQNIFIILKGNLVPISSYFPFRPHPCSWQPVIFFLSLWIGPFWTFHITRIIQGMVFCDWLLSLSIMFSRFIHIETHIRISFLFLAQYYSIVWIYHLALFNFRSTDEHLDCSHFLAIMNLVFFFFNIFIGV